MGTDSVSAGRLSRLRVIGRGSISTGKGSYSGMGLLPTCDDRNQRTWAGVLSWLLYQSRVVTCCEEKPKSPKSANRVLGSD